MVEPPAGGGEVASEPVDGRPIDLESGGLAASRDRLEVGPQGARLVHGGQVAPEREARRRGEQYEQQEATQEQEIPKAMRPPPPATPWG